MDPAEIVRCLPEHLTLEDKLGEGGVASVYRVFNTRLQTHWALKVLERNKIASRKGMSKTLKEARFTARLQHANVATIHDVDEANGFIFIELIDGPSLTQVIEAGIHTWDAFQTIARGVLAGLAEAHRNGIIHGDISPNNILLTATKVPKLVDFGFARHIDYSSSSIGLTPGYASPEHVLGKKLTPQSDVFSVGAVLFQLATSHQPFEWDNHYAYAYAIVNEEPREPEFVIGHPPNFLASLLMRALSVAQGRRYPSAVEMEAAFAAGLKTPAIRPVEVNTTTPSHRARLHLERGLKYYGGTSHDEMDWAEQEFRAALERDPDLSQAYVGLADVAIFRYMSYFDRSIVGLARAEHYCRKALERDPECAEAYRSLGRIHMTRRELTQARENFARAITLNPDFLAAHMSLGWCLVEAHDLAAAEKAALDARAIAEDNLEVMLLLVRIYYYRKEYERSCTIAQEAISVDRTSGRAYYDIAMGQRALGNFADARISFATSIEFHGDPNAPIDLGLLELMEGNYERAITMFEKASEEATFAFLARYYLGFAKHLCNRRDDARNDFKTSLDLSVTLARRNPIDPYPLVVTAMSSAGIGDSARVHDAIHQARDMDQRDGLVAFYAACALSWLDDKKATDQLLAEALALPCSPSEIEASLDPHFQRTK